VSAVTHLRRRPIGQWAVTASAITFAAAGAVAAIVFAVVGWSEIQRLDFRYIQNIGAALGHGNHILLAAIGLLAAILFGITAARGLFVLAAQLVLTCAAAAAVDWLVFSSLMDIWGWMFAIRSTDRAHELFLSSANVLPQAAHPWWLVLVGALFASVFGVALLRTRVLRWR